MSMPSCCPINLVKKVIKIMNKQTSKVILEITVHIHVCNSGKDLLVYSCIAVDIGFS